MDKTRILCTGGSGFIGTHLIESLLAQGLELINVDVEAPKIRTQDAYWCECNILDLDRLKKVFEDFQPSHVVHLAARTTMAGKTLDDFRDNTVGTANLLESVKLNADVARVLITSSQHVRKPGSGNPKNDMDYKPHGLYGESKVITEKLTREANLDCVWTIVRPTTVWGPWHPSLPHGLWRYMRRGWYIHPRNDPVVRSYGYVKNVVWQFERILQAPVSLVNRKVYYVGEEPILQRVWIDAFSRALCGRDARELPREMIYVLALIGDALGLVGMKFPMDRARYFNLTTTNPVPITPVTDAFGAPPYSLEAGLQETVAWLDQQGLV